MVSTVNDLGLDPGHIPAHVAIIMDGNGRWARQRDLDRLRGHWQGYAALRRTVYAAEEIGIRYLTVYGFSSENWRRPELEVSGLMHLMNEAMHAELEELINNDIRVRISGRVHELPENVRQTFLNAQQRTAHFSKLTFTLAINYGGRAEIVDAVRQIARRAASGELNPETIDEATISGHLYWPDVPDPDLLIRTASEYRVSNFLMWESAYTELHVTSTLWPDFDMPDLVAAVRDYQGRTRKFGAVVEPV
jgi:undecaprenyl diphosphate synthase